MERTSLAEDVCWLMLVFVALVLCGNEVHSQIVFPRPINIDPRFQLQPIAKSGLQFRLSQRGFDYAAGVALDLLFNEVQKIRIPDQSGKASVLFSNANYYVTDMQVTGVTKPSSNVGVTPGRITWTLTNAGISIRGNWRYYYKLLGFIPIRDSGSFTGSASGGSISLSVSLGLDSTGHPTISTTGCSCSISSVSIRVSGGASWLYNLFIGYVERPVRNQLQSKICEAATSIVNGNANRLLSSFPLQHTVATDYLFDYRFLSAPQIQSGFMDTKHKAAFYYRGDRTDAPIQGYPFPTATTSSKMLTIWVSDYVLNTIGSVLYRQNILRYTVTKSDIQNSYKSYLDTTCRSSYCFGSIFPILSTLYPDATVEVEMTATQAPTSNISSNGIQVTFSGDISVRVRLANGSVVNFLTASVTLNVVGWVNLNAATLRGIVLRMVPTVSNIRSSVGSVPESSAISGAINRIGDLFIIPKLNEKGQQGIPLPVLDFVKFKDVTFEMLDHCLRITTNVEKTP